MFKQRPIESNIDPYAIGLVKRRAPYDFVGTRHAMCWACVTVTTQEGFRTFGSAWIGFQGLFDPRPSTLGKTGTRILLWACTDCSGFVEEQPAPDR